MYKVVPGLLETQGADREAGAPAYRGGTYNGGGKNLWKRGLGPAPEGESPSASSFLQRWSREGERRVIDRSLWPSRRLMQSCLLMSTGQTVDGHYPPQNSFYEDRVLDVGEVSSCCSY